MAKQRKSKVSLSGLTREYKATTQLEAEAASLNWVAALVAALVILGGAVINRLTEDTWEPRNIYIIFGTALVASICFFGVKIANQWERAVVLRLGKFRALRGPGPFFIIPIIESVVQTVDMRIRSTDFSSESTLTKDTVPVNVDAICFWMVWDAKKQSSKSRTFTWP